MKTYILLGMSLISFSCRREVAPNQLTLGAKVSSLAASDCKLPLLDFGTGADQIGQLTTTGKGATVYYAVYLDKQFSVGDRLSVVIRTPTQDETPVCTTMGPGYPAITVVGATKK